MELPNTVEGCHIVINQLLLIIEHQEKQIDELKSRFAELESHLNQNSRNSSRPLYSDGAKRKVGIPKEPKVKGGQMEQSHKTPIFAQITNAHGSKAPIRFAGFSENY